MRAFIIIILLFNTLLSFGQTETGFVERAGAKIYYKVFGRKGKPVLMINGGPGFSSNYLDDVAQDLSKQGYKIILFDQRGTGKSEVRAITKNYISNKKTIDDIDALINHLGYRKVHIIGHAYGGALALMYGTKYPKKVNKIILSSSIGMNLDFVAPMMANLRLRLNANKQKQLATIREEYNSGQVNMQEAYKKRFDLMAEAYVYNRKKLDIVKQMHSLPKDYVYEVNHVIWSDMENKNFGIMKRIANYNGEVLILHGRQDVIGESVPIYTHRALPNSRLIFINEAARYLWIDQPDQYFEHVNDFLK